MALAFHSCHFGAFRANSIEKIGNFFIMGSPNKEKRKRKEGGRVSDWGIGREKNGRVGV